MEIYTCIVIQTDDDEKVLDLCRNIATQRVWVSPPSRGFVCVFQDWGHEQSKNSLALSLSKQLKCAVLDAVYFDGFSYTAYANGEKCDEHDSRATPPVIGNASKLCELFDIPKQKKKVSEALVWDDDDAYPNDEQLNKLVVSRGMQLEQIHDLINSKKITGTRLRELMANTTMPGGIFRELVAALRMPSWAVNHYSLLDEQHFDHPNILKLGHFV